MESVYENRERERDSAHLGLESRICHFIGPWLCLVGSSPLGVSMATPGDVTS